MSNRHVSRLAWVLLSLAGLVIASPAHGQPVSDVVFGMPGANDYARDGDALMARHQIEPAIAAFTEAIKRVPGQAEYYHKRGLLYQMKQSFFKAEDDFSEMIRLDPANAEGYYLRATCQPFPPLPGVWDQTAVGSGEVVRPDPLHYRTLADLTEAIRLDPRLAKAYMMRAGAQLLWTHDYEKTVADCDAALRLLAAGPPMAYLSAHVCWTRGYAHALLKGDHDKAIADYTQALSLYPKLPAALASRAASYHKLGKLGQAVDDYTAAIGIDPQYGFAYVQRAEVFAQMGDAKAAEADRAKARTLACEPFAVPNRP